MKKYMDIAYPANYVIPPQKFSQVGRPWLREPNRGAEFPWCLSPQWPTQTAPVQDPSQASAGHRARILGLEKEWKDFSVPGFVIDLEMKGKLFFSITRIAKGIVPIVQSSYVPWQPFINSQQIMMGKSNVYHQSLPEYTDEILRLLSSIIFHIISPNPDCVWNHPAFGVELRRRQVEFGASQCTRSTVGTMDHLRGCFLDQKQQVSSDKKTLRIISYFYGLLHDRILILAYGKNKFLPNGKLSLFIGFFRIKPSSNPLFGHWIEFFYMIFTLP